MPKDKLTDYSATNASNTDVGGVNTDEGMLPSAVNNAIREVMTHLKNFAAGTDGIDVLSLADDDASAAMKIQAPASVTADTTLTLPDGDGDDGQALVTDGSGTLSWASLHSAKNLIINGAMTISQRSTSKTGITAGGFHALDRFYWTSVLGDTITLSQSTEAPDGFSNSLKVAVTTGDSDVSNVSDRAMISQSIEAQNLQHLQYGASNAKTMILSFWVRSDVTGTYAVGVYQHDASPARFYSSTYTVDTADTWEYKTVTISGDTSGTINNDNGKGLEIYWWLAASSTYTGGVNDTWGTESNKWGAGHNVNVLGTTGNDWHLTGVQLTVGDVDLPFIHESFAETELKCKRYYQKIADRDVTPANGVATISRFVANAYATTNGALQHHFEIEMRDAPTVTYFDVSIVSGKTAGWYNGAWRGADASSSQIYSNAVHIELANPSPTFAGTSSAYILQLNFVMDAEL
jgi:hypothetical protein